MATISITDIVSDDINGNGVFDLLIASVERRLEDQYTKGRITGSDYANVYLGAMQSVLQQSIAYTLGVQQADKQADLISSQIVLTDKQSVSEDAKLLQIQAQTTLIDNQAATELKQALIAVEQALLVTEQKNLAIEQIASSQAKTIRDDNLSIEQVKLVTEQKNLAIEQVTSSQAKTVRDNALSAEQVNLAIEQVISSQATTTRNNSLSAEQVLKLQKETSLLNQKVFTEQSQILDTVNGNPVAGIVGKQKTLYENQAKGFTRDAEQKAIKAFTDIWTIAKSTDPDSPALALPLNVDQHSMDVVLGKLAINAGLVANQAELGVASEEFTTHTISTTVDPGAADVIVTTIDDHGMTTGDAIKITGVTTMTLLNGKNFIITSTGAKTFTLDNTSGTAYGSNGSGGTVTELK